MKERLDVLLVKRGLAASREKAKAVIMAGSVFVDNQKEDKAGTMFPDTVQIEVRGNTLKYVSRGGLKLEKAMTHFGLRLDGCVCMDVGSSTGGFTDCLLQHGAARVIAVDVGHGQLAPSLRTDPRVISMEGVNARSLTPEDIVSRPDLVVCDLSFISQTLIYPAVAKLLDCGGVFVTLIKPQFEAGRDKLGKNGIVRDRRVHAAVITSLFSAAREYGLYPEAVIPSPITGGDGNREYLALFRREKVCHPLPTDAIPKAVFGS